jgi:hypothetical protein
MNMINPNTTATTNEITALAGLTPGRLSQLERDGIIKRTDKNSWPLVETISKLFAEARARGEAASESRRRFEAARAEREEIKLAEAKRQMYDTMFEEILGKAAQYIGDIMSELNSLPVRLYRDLKERRRLADAIAVIRNKSAAALRAEAKCLTGPK